MKAQNQETDEAVNKDQDEMFVYFREEDCSERAWDSTNEEDFNDRFSMPHFLVERLYQLNTATGL